MKPGFPHLACAALLGAGLLAAPRAGAAQRVRWSVPMGYDSLGVNHQRIYDAFSRMVAVVSQKTGLDVQLEILPSNELAKQRGVPGNVVAMHEAMRRVKEKSAEVIYLYPEEYLLHERLRQNLLPALGWTVKGSAYGKACLFVSKAKGFKTMSDLKGKTLNGLTDYVTVRSLLAQGGVNQPVAKFFGAIGFHANPAIALESLLKGESDAAYMGWQKWLFVQKQKPEFKNVAPLICRDNEPFVFLAARRDLPTAALDKLGLVLQNAHRDPSFSTIRWFFLAFQGSLFRMKPDYLRSYQSWFEQARQKGWVKEAKDWFDREAPSRYKAWVKTHP